MRGYYERKWSKAALRCQALAALALPYFAMTILLHRFGKVSTPQTFWLLGFGLVLVVLALAFGAKAVADLWDGMRGGRQAVRGLILATALILPFGWMATLAIRHPPMSDITTEPFQPPAMAFAAELRARDPATNPLSAYDDAYASRMLAAYPRVVPRRYNAGAPRVLSAVVAIMRDRSWQIISQLPGGAEGEATQGEGEGNVAESALPQNLPEVLRIDAVARSMVFGFRHDVVVEIATEAESTLVNMRSSSRYGAHDFGSNAALIEGFLSRLDNALVGIAGEG